MISYVNIRDKISLGLRNILNINGYYPQAMAPVAAGYKGIIIARTALLDLVRLASY